MISKIKIGIADDEALFRQGLKAILQNEDSIDVLFDAEDGKDLLYNLKTAEPKPEIVITDLKMPNLNGVEVTKVIRKKYPEIKIIALTSYFSKPFILNMISIGAVAYLAKNSAPELMIKTIKEVHKNGFFYGEVVQKYVQESDEKSKKTKSTLDNKFVTKRELEILQLICKQYTAKDIAEELDISDRTVELHRSNLLYKTDTKNIAGLVVFALKNKIVDLEKDSF